MAKALINGINMHYLVKGEGPPVLLIHGVATTMAVWYTRIIPELSQRYKVVAYDLRGHGYSDLTPTGYTSAELAADLAGLLEHLDLSDVRLVGHSFGGSVALQCAARYPERLRGVLVSDSGIACLRHLREIKDWHGWITWGQELAQYGMNYDWFVKADNGDVADVFRKASAVPNPYALYQGSRGKARLQRIIEETSIPRDFREVAGLDEACLARIATPIFALYGKTSPFRRVGPHLETIMPNCRCELLDGTGHYSVLDAVDVFLDGLHAFLADPGAFVAARAERPTPQAEADSTPTAPAGSAG
jgi:2-hydroxy-6-oxonona-2,4-dienedioate hydrolase